MSQNNSNSSDSSDPSNSPDQEDSYDSSSSAKNDSDKKQSKSNSDVKNQEANSISLDYTSDASSTTSTTEPSKNNKEKNQNTKKSSKEEDSDSSKSTDSEQNPKANKNVNLESVSDQIISTNSDNYSDIESAPKDENAKAKPEKTVESKSELKSTNKDSDSDSENKSESSDSEEKPKNKKSSDKKLQTKERSAKISAKEESKKEKRKDAKKSSNKNDKASTSKKSKKPVEEEKVNSKQSKNKSKTSDDTKDEENASKRSKKSQNNKKSKHQTRSKDNDDDDNEYDNDSNNENRQPRVSQLSAEALDEAFEREDAVIEAVYQFNSRKNVSKLCAYYNTEETPEGIAHVIRTTKGLNGEIIGDYLGKKENVKILKAYFMEVDMKCGYIEAMRRSLSGPMFLPGEGQIIDRIVQELANCYVQQNPGKYSNPDELYALSFALVMLNSDLHNPNVSKKMTVKDFIHNTRHLLSADDVTDKELTEMYNEIQSTPFSFTNHTNDFWWEVAPKIRGYLQKKSEHSFSKWTKKYFVLTNSCLYYFKDDNPANEGKPLGVIQLTEVEVNADSKDPLLIKIAATNDEISYVKFKKIPKPIRGIKRIFFKAPDRASASRWLHRIKKSAIMSNFLSDKMNENKNVNQKM